MNSNPSVIISVLNWNNASDTIRCINSLLLLDYKQFEIVVVDNASTDGSIQLIEAKFPEVRVVKSKSNLGYAGGNSLVVDSAIKEEFDAVWVLNNDAIAEKDSLSSLVSSWQQNGEGIFGSVIVNQITKFVEFSGGYELNDSGELDIKSIYNNLPKIDVLHHIEKYGKLRKVADVNGASIFIPMSVLKKVGFMSERFFLYAEELEYCFRLKKEFNISSFIVNNSIVYHEGSASFEKNKGLKPIQQYYNRRNFTWLQIHHFDVSKSDIINKMGGRKVFFIRLLKCFLSSLFFYKPSPDTEMIAIFHAFKNKLGRVYDPEKFIENG
ncbi:MAG: glycosyltransferase family 2 protein [Bacteroidota bacterium]